MKPALISLVAALALLPAARLQAEPPEGVLERKGLTRVGYLYLLKPDVELPQFLEYMHLMQKAADQNNRDRITTQQTIDAVSGVVKELDAKNRHWTSVLQSTPKSSVDDYNSVVRTVNDIRANLRDKLAAIDSMEKDLARIEQDDSPRKFVDSVLEVSDLMEALSKQYQTVAADAEVRAALEEINQTQSYKLKLGPSGRLTQELPLVRKLRLTANAATLKVFNAGGVNYVTIVLNNALAEPMMVDSGAAIVVLSGETAKKIGLHPSGHDRTMQLRMADGAIVDAPVLVVPVMRAGPFAVKDIDCCVTPLGMPNSHDILGGTFLRHFEFKLDATAGVLKLSRITAPQPPSPTAPGNASAGGGPAATGFFAPDEPAADPANRAPAPADALLKKSAAQIRDLLGKQYADPSPAGKRALAAALFKLGVTTSGNQADRFELFREACDAAVDGGDPGTAFRAMGEMCRAFDLNTPQKEADLLTRLAPKAVEPQDAAQLTFYGVPAIKGLFTRGLPAQAAPLIPLVLTAAYNSKDAALGAATRHELKWALIEQTQKEAGLAAIERLKTSPGDSDASLAAGRYYCFFLNDFPRGLPLLTHGSDPILKLLATADLANPTDKTTRAQLAEMWLGASTLQSPTAAKRCRERAWKWHELAGAGGKGS